jgi:hypothetical protein
MGLADLVRQILLLTDHVKELHQLVAVLEARDKVQRSVIIDLVAREHPDFADRIQNSLRGWGEQALTDPGSEHAQHPLEATEAIVLADSIEAQILRYRNPPARLRR